MSDAPITPDEQRKLNAYQAEHLRLMRELCRPRRKAFRSSQLDWEQVDYILQRNELQRAINIISEINPEFIAFSKDEGRRLIDETLSRMAAILFRMQQNEKKYFYPTTK